MINASASFTGDGHRANIYVNSFIPKTKEGEPAAAEQWGFRVDFSTINGVGRNFTQAEKSFPSLREAMDAGIGKLKEFYGNLGIPIDDLGKLDGVMA